MYNFTLECLKALFMRFRVRYSNVFGLDDTGTAICLYSCESSSSLGANKSSVCIVQSGVKRPQCETDHAAPPSVSNS